MKGFVVSMVALLAISIAIAGLALSVAIFSGMPRSAGLFGWSDTPILSGVEIFFTAIYNAMVFVASWIRLFVLFVVFLAIQGVFVYVYYRIGKIFLQFRHDLEKILDELLDI